MDDGRVFIIWPASGMFAAHEAIKNKELDEEGDGHPCKAEGGVIQCVPIENSAEPLMLPGLPSLPHLRFNIDDEGSDLPAKKPPKLVKIAAGECFILGLTDQGHVVCIDVQGGDEDEGIDHLRAIFTNGVQGWTYLPEYCDIREVVKDPVYAPRENGKPQVLPPKTLRITHISAHFNYFVTYSPGTSSTVLMSFVKREAAAPIESITRTIHPTLQNQDIISVVLGDYHFGALHGDGTLYTWGRYSNGALGLGDPTKLPLGAPGGYSTAEARNEARQRKVIGDIPPPDVEVPSPVRFDWDEPERNRFCFAVAAFGWQMGALVIDLDDSPDDENESLPEKEEKETRHGIEKRSKPSVKSNSIKESGWKKWKRLACGCFGN
ncbi:hypothetical protein FRC02_002301 [Tulasnella sp. 418]|nr:hypothetical protein FRC02_002301 [Tulasnella sp. 418]